MANVDGFLPELCGFRFANNFPSAPLLAVAIPGRGAVAIGDASNGLCGGMVFAARDYFESHRPLPNDGEAPLPGSTLFEYIVRRLIDSFALPEGPIRYFQWMALPDEDSWIGSGVATLTRGEGLRIKRELERGRLCCLGLVRARSLDVKDLSKNHQVLAYAYDEDLPDARAIVRVYDPNHPGAESEMSYSLTPGGPLDLQHSTGEITRGFFVTPYEREDPNRRDNGLLASSIGGLRRALARLIGGV